MSKPIERIEITTWSSGLEASQVGLQPSQSNSFDHGNLKSSERPIQKLWGVNAKLFMWWTPTHCGKKQKENICRLVLLKQKTSLAAAEFSCLENQEFVVPVSTLFLPHTRTQEPSILRTYVPLAPAANKRNAVGLKASCSLWFPRKTSNKSRGSDIKLTKYGHKDNHMF